MLTITYHLAAVWAIYRIGMWDQRRVDARARIQTRLGEPIEWNEVAK